MDENRRKQHIVLVHGAGHGAWCWYKLATMLRSAGHRVTVPDLAASGVDSRRVEELTSFVDYSQPLFEIMASLLPEEIVVLVGHSLGGINIAMAMERFPERVAVAIFVTAYMPDCTHSIQELFQQYYQQNLSAYDQMDNTVNVQGDPESNVITSASFGHQFIAARLYQLSPPEDVTLAAMLVRPSSARLAEYHDSVPSFSKDRYGSVDCVYIVCREDRMISEGFQRWMVQNHPVKQVVEVEGADHMPMMSKPQELCRSILRILDNI